MGTCIFVGNLPFNATDDQPRELFTPHGVVASISIAKDEFTDLSEGFGSSDLPAVVELEPVAAVPQPAPRPAPVAKPLWNVTMLGVMAGKRRVSSRPLQSGIAHLGRMAA
jgi:hypothetical protein